MTLRRPKKRVRMQLRNDETLEGVLDGLTGGHYRLLTPTIVRVNQATREIETHAVDCLWLEVPKENVLFYEVKAL